MSKYVFFTGGVVSGLGKGVTAAALGRLFKARGYTVDVIKFNPYFNIDSSNICPGRHGEVYITADGRACDSVVGQYERILGCDLGSRNDVTSGEIYSTVISKERLSSYDGNTVQVVPHITDEIKNRILAVGQKGADVVIVEIGGIVGDIEAQPFFEAIRQLRSDLGKNNVAYVHVSLVTFIDVSGEQKTKPTQHSVKELQNLGIQPDIIICRSENPLEGFSRNKLSQFCNVDKDCIIENLVTENVYNIPLMLEQEKLCGVILRRLKMDEREPDLGQWINLCERIKTVESGTKAVKIGIVGEFAGKYDAYVSLKESLKLSGVTEEVNVGFAEINSAGVSAKDLVDLDGVVITSGVTKESLGGKVFAAEYARKKKIPALLVGEACFTGLPGLSEEQILSAVAAGSYSNKGVFKTNFVKGTRLYDIYGASAEERHGCKLSIPAEFIAARPEFAASGISAFDNGVDAFELKDGAFYAGVSFRPEFSGKPESPNKLLSAFVRALAAH